MVHLSDISWDDTGEAIIRDYKKGQELETVVLAVDPERERISLGIKQLDKDPMSSFLALNEKGAIVHGTVQEVDAKGAVIALGDGIEGYLRASELSRDRVEDARSVLKEGEPIEAKFMGMDRKNRTISLSVKAKDYEEEKAAMATYGSDAASAGTTAFGELLKDHLDANKE